MDQHSRLSEDEVNLVESVKVVYRYRVMIMALALISILFAGISTLMKPGVYEAAATFFPMDIKQSYNPQSGTFSMRRSLSIENLIISILKSRKMADKIIEQIDLQRIWNVKLMADARKYLEKSTKITLEKNGIIKLCVYAGSPELSADIANAYVDNLDYFNSQLDIGAEKQIVQVIDRAVAPEKRMPRGTMRIMLLAGLGSLMAGVCLAFFIEFLKKIKNA